MRYAGPDDFLAITELDGASFGFHYGERDRADALLDVEPSRFLIEEDAGRIVGVTVDMPFRMTLPGGADRPVAGITWVSVEITHRRRGILSALMERQLRDRAADGFAAAVLTASEGGIYGRYGFGQAEVVHRISVDRHRARLTEALSGDGVRRMTTDEARVELADLWDRWRRTTPGALDRSAVRWQFDLLDRPHQRDGASGLFHLVHPDGFVTYRIAEDWNDQLPRHALRIVDYAPITPAAHRALWATLLAVDLVGTIECTGFPVDDPLPYLLTDRRLLRTHAVMDALWVRPLDVPALLAGRTYAVEVDTVLHIVDPLLGDARCRLAGGPDGASCSRTDALPELTIGVAELGAVALGGQRLVQLAAAGRVHGEARAVTRLDRAFLADRAPRHGTRF